MVFWSIDLQMLSIIMIVKDPKATYQHLHKYLIVCHAVCHLYELLHHDIKMYSFLCIVWKQFFNITEVIKTKYTPVFLSLCATISILSSINQCSYIFLSIHLFIYQCFYMYLYLVVLYSTSRYIRIGVKSKHLTLFSYIPSPNPFMASFVFHPFAIDKIKILFKYWSCYNKQFLSLKCSSCVPGV